MWRAAGRRVPDDVAVVGFDDSPSAAHTDPPLTTVHQPVEAMGREMVRLLVEALTPGRPWREEPRVHPYTLDGRQVDVCWDGEWVEVWECGLAHPAVLAAAGPGC